MSEDTTYNGWTNYPTWVIHLWLTNEERSYIAAREIARGAEHNCTAGDALKSWLDEMMPGLGACVWSDLLRWAFDSANWTEIAEALREE